MSLATRAVWNSPDVETRPPAEDAANRWPGERRSLRAAVNRLHSSLAGSVNGTVVESCLRHQLSSGALRANRLRGSGTENV